MAPTKSKKSNNRKSNSSSITKNQDIHSNLSNEENLKKKIENSTSLSNKYASKYIDEVLSSIISSNLANITKHKSTISKWCDKMRLSILRKVSNASKKAFVTPEYDLNYLESSIVDIKEKITIRENRITTRATTLLKGSPLHDFQDSIENNKPVEKKFEDQTKRIGDRFAAIAEKISSIQDNIPKRINGLLSVIASIDKLNLKKLIEATSNGDINDNEESIGTIEDEEEDNVNNNNEIHEDDDHDPVNQLRNHLSNY